MTYPDGMRPLFEEGAEAILGTYNALMDAQSTGTPFADPFAPHLDRAEAIFTRGAVAGDVEGMVAGWNELVAVAGRISGAVVPIAVFLLASVVNQTELKAAEILAQAVARADE